jgi:hypothetical protein
MFFTRTKETLDSLMNIRNHLATHPQIVKFIEIKKYISNYETDPSKENANHILEMIEYFIRNPCTQNAPAMFILLDYVLENLVVDEKLSDDIVNSACALFISDASLKREEPYN